MKIIYEQNFFASTQSQFENSNYKPDGIYDNATLDTRLLTEDARQ